MLQKEIAPSIPLEIELSQNIIKLLDEIGQETGRSSENIVLDMLEKHAEE